MASKWCLWEPKVSQKWTKVESKREVWKNITQNLAKLVRVSECRLSGGGGGGILEAKSAPKCTQKQSRKRTPEKGGSGLHFGAF